MADKKSDLGEQVTNRETEERVRGVAEEDAEFDDNEDLDEDDAEDDEEGGSTF